jgi:hypothetical protein
VLLIVKKIVTEEKDYLMFFFSLIKLKKRERETPFPLSFHRSARKIPSLRGDELIVGDGLYR